MTTTTTTTTTSTWLRPDICLTLEGTKVYVDYQRLADGRIIPVFNGRKVGGDKR